MKGTLVFVLAALAAAVIAPAQSAGFIIDRVAAVVNGEVITKSELDSSVNAEARRRGITAEAGLGELRREVLETLIDRKLILSDLRKFNIVEATGEEVDKAIESVKAGFGSEEEFNRALDEEDMTLGDLRENLAEQILVRKYVDRRIRFFVRVTLDDQKKYYQEHIGEFGGRSFTEVSSETYELLMEKYTDKKLDEYVKELRARADITVNQPVE